MLYERPANAFVAGFVGNPPMNLLPSRLRLDPPGQCLLALGEQWLRGEFSEADMQRLQALLDQPLTLGIRPEAGCLTDADGIIAEVVDVEYLGHETLLRVSIAAALPAENLLLIIRLAGMQVFNRGDSVKLDIDSRQLYLFEADSGLAAIGPPVN
jgi:ABC-type sugar transport system ATPase subunit